MKRLLYYYIYLIVVWTGFRYFVHLPEVFEELWFKPVIWLTPLFWWQLSMKSRISIFGKNGLSSLIVGAVVGVMYFLVIRRLQISGIKWEINVVGIVLATAITEELVFSGFIAGYLEKIRKGKWTNFLIVGLMVILMRLPILLFVFKPNLLEIVGVLLFAGASGVINAWIRIKTGNVSGSILARMGINLAVLG